MVLSNIDLTSGILTLHAKESHAQLGLPAVRSLAASKQNGHWVIHAVGADQACLFTFSAHPTHHEDWDASLRTIFPKLR